MILSFEDNKKRKVIPRWLPFDLSNAIGSSELATSYKRGPQNHIEYNIKESLFLEDKNLVNASDFLGAALQLGDFQNKNALNAAKFIQRTPKSSEVSISIANRFLENSEMNVSLDSIPIERNKYYNLIHKIKTDLSIYHNNPIKWVDLAFYYAAIGENSKARKAMMVALDLGGKNRHVIRSASRFFVHNGEADISHTILNADKSLHNDPWILASSIAISDAFNFDIFGVKKGLSLIESKNYSHHSLSELAAAIGTLEIQNGAIKKGKKLFRETLIAPTENSLAQTVWLNNTLRLDLSDEFQKLSFLFEANYRIKYLQSDYENALKSLWGWSKFQPFTSEPSATGSFIASTILGDFEQGIEFAKFGRISSPQSFQLNNNLAFSYASLNKIREAHESLSNIDESILSDLNKATLSATKGLIELRQGNIQKGEQLYKNAIETFKLKKEKKSEMLATFFFAREQTRLNNLDIASKLLQVVKSFADKEKNQEIIDAMRFNLNI